MKKIAFLDMEASGLSASSWPIEVGWCQRGDHPQSFLIAPAPDWSQDAWTKSAEALHGITYETLIAKGHPVDEVCGHLNRALTGATVLSDAPDWDGFWLYRLFNAAGLRQEFRLTDFASQFGETAPEKIRKAVEKASVTTPHTHRAVADVLHMNAVFDLLAPTVE